MPDTDIDPAILATLQVLCQAMREGGTTPWSLAKIAKRAQLPMSVLRRVLTQLQAAGLADFAIDEAGHGHASLTPAGAELAAQVFPQTD
ncbi:Rrf2 family transcriptional regulator [Cupriavidus oxalaticus]|jgi:DNA-binding IclR family transcriptional regulator|uniref:Transcriptional regulator n=1 Tax=Cupriavidus oxalaticus TaxID=96344 RepID=A0A375GPI4_9BURK|nr:Rrf2 family transcriptional regulator [Cupriavidus oxalaticus]QEZ43166.1 transcriptional regulator [Cupriavidus oxalaticus]QRQ85447.1 Rrf2 family transcriptional regulator [Cupriavidus oxalaticus]QRQ90465.1 Rrf2 family transcriptional regulator [Cupriavidus oxalaticus]WQD84982.1 Rrf2 family transcriptional regulator [Cupriavidus oxalaticus]SPC08324.1 Transcriptional regulator [Cupriavidus oxalaticus]